MKAIILIGIPASGKSTLADKLILDGYKSVGADRVREELYGDAAVQGDPETVWNEFYLRLESLLATRFDVVIDNTSVRARDRKKVLDFCTRYGYSVEYWLLQTPLEVCLKRNKARTRVVPEEVILRMARTLQENIPLLREECSVTVIK